MKTDSWISSRALGLPDAMTPERPGSVPSRAGGGLRRLLPRFLGGGIATDRPGAFDETFRLLALEIDKLARERDLHTILVMGSYSGDGRTTTVANLGKAMAALGRRVVVAATDTRHLDLAELTGTDPLEATTDSHGVAGLQVVSTATPGLLLAGGRALQQEISDTKGVEAALAELKETADFVILDSPPCLDYGHAFFLAPLVDGVVFVVRRRAQDVEQQRGVQARLARLGVNVIGAIYNHR